MYSNLLNINLKRVTCRYRAPLYQYVPSRVCVRFSSKCTGGWSISIWHYIIKWMPRYVWMRAPKTQSTASNSSSPPIWMNHILCFWLTKSTTMKPQMNYSLSPLSAFEGHLLILPPIFLINNIVIISLSSNNVSVKICCRITSFWGKNNTYRSFYWTIIYMHQV